MWRPHRPQLAIPCSNPLPLRGAPGRPASYRAGGSFFEPHMGFPALQQEFIIGIEFAIELLETSFVKAPEDNIKAKRECQKRSRESSDSWRGGVYEASDLYG